MASFGGTLLLVVALIFTLTDAATPAPWTSLKVKYGLDGFYYMPTSISEITKSCSKQFVYVDSDPDLNCTLYSYQNDPRVMILFDFYGNVAGLRTCYIKKDVTRKADSKHIKFAYRYDDIPMFTSHKYWGIDSWCTSVLFLSPDKLKAGGRQKTTKEVEWSEVWVKPEGTYINITRNESRITQQLFTKQNCFIGMGKHYFYNMTTTLDCATWPAVFMLYDGGDLAGLGIVPTGSFTHTDRVWFEDPGVMAAKMIIPHRPDCVLKYARDFGSTSLHIFFKKHPMLTFCF